MVVGQVDGAGAELDVFRVVEQPGDEQQGRCDRLGGVRQMLAEEAFDETETVGHQGQLAVLLERLCQITADRMDRHGEEAKLHEQHSL
jgi:hypothetical protein